MANEAEPVPPPLAGPFTPAPRQLVVVFEDDSAKPVLFYDIYGRPVIADDNDANLMLVSDYGKQVRRFDPSSGWGDQGRERSRERERER